MSRKIFNYRPGPEDLTLKSLAQVELDADAILLDVMPFFDVDSIVSVVENQKRFGVPVFIIIGQRGMYEQQEAEKKEKIAEDAGAISLGAHKQVSMTLSGYDTPTRLVEGLEEIFSTDAATEDKVREARTRLYHPPMGPNEFASLVDFMFKGGSLELGKFVYADYAKWLAVRNSPDYAELADATRQATLGLVGPIVSEMSRRGINDFYSMGPTSSIDARLLEEAVRVGHVINYHPIDISSQAIFDAVKDVTADLDAKVGGWRDYVTLVETKPQLFENVENGERSFVLYPGGQIVNNPDLLYTARDICHEDGLVGVDLHLRESESDEALWKKFYDIEEEREMFRQGVLQFMPELAGVEGWDIGVEYVDGSPNRISFQLQTDRTIESSLNLVPVTLEPGIVRELMMSEKYTEKEFANKATEAGFDVLEDSRVPVEHDGLRGFGASILLGYDQLTTNV